MIECKNESTWSVLKKDYDDFLLLFILSFIIILYLQKSFLSSIFKSSVVLGIFLVLDMSCYHIDYIRGLFVAVILGTQLEHIYRLVHFFIVEWLYKKKKIIDKILEREHIEINDDTKDKPNETNK